MQTPVWFRVTLIFVMGGLALAVWVVPARTTPDFERLAALLHSHRHAWYAMPAVMLAFVVFGLALVPVILLIAVTGVAFGPLLGPIYAMAGCLTSAAAGFAIGRILGLQRVTEFGGERMIQITRALKRNGTLAVFLVRKVPAPFTIVNIIVGASTVRFRDFMVGTVLGMGAFVIGLAGFGYQATSALRDPSAGTLLGAALFVAVPLTLAMLINRALRPARPAE
jgi:uncharacterized membrane protein YdjX (TVP38/TMEM64 family)